MSKELFDQILDAIEESPYEVPPFIISRVKIGVVEHRVREFYNYDNILKVMNSSIFHEGGLKGKTLPGEPPTFKVIAIKDLIYLIVEASILLDQPNLEDSFKDSISLFDSAIKNIDTLKVVAQFYRSWVTNKKLDKIIKELTDLKSKLLRKPNPGKLHFRMDRFTRAMPDRIDKLIELFKEQVPEAKPYTIGRAIHKLHTQFGILSTEAAITQRIYRKRLIK